MNKIKILFDATILSAINQNGENRGGVFFVAYNIFKKFVQDELFDITLYLEKSSYLKLIKSNPFLSSFKIVCANFVLGDAKNNKSIKNTKFNPMDYDAYFNVDQYSKLDDNSIPHFYVLHDTIPLIYPWIFTKEGRLIFFKNYNEILDNNTYCFCVSQSCKQSFLRFFPIIDEKKMLVTPIASAQNFSVKKDKKLIEKVLKKYNIYSNDKYILTTNAFAQRKNSPFAISCFLKFIDLYNINDLNFYLVGHGEPDSIISQLDNEAAFLYEKYKSKIFFLGYVDDEDLNLLYSNALFFTFISIFEGFGMPALEAMMAGTPVITSNNSSLPEVVGDAAIKINPRGGGECIEAMKRLYFDENLREILTRKGKKRARLFNWEKCFFEIKNKIVEVSCDL